jgi:hypothetical protein
MQNKNKNIKQHTRQWALSHQALTMTTKTKMVTKQFPSVCLGHEAKAWLL